MQTEIMELATFTEESYLNYSMYVIKDRALPAISDGLKPVQRRIIYAMHQLGLDNKAKYKKSARTVGDVLGKYHPHGDSACYEAMVLMAQPFSYRYPLIEGQGNWGSPDDPKSFAAMRYTESKLSKYSALLLEELNLGTVEYKLNFDGSFHEPISLPSLVPNILLNGATGIAVGMATDIPPHNISEIINATKLLIKQPNCSLNELLEEIKGPDFPCSSTIILTKSEIENMYLTGKGSIKARAIYHIEKNNIIFDSLPYQASGAKIVEQIANQMIAKKLPFVTDLRDEADHSTPTRIVVQFKSKGPSPETIISHLYSSTDLQKTYRVNMNMIGLDGKPKVKPLLNILQEWIVYRKKTVLNRTQFQLDKRNKRIHILEGLVKAFINIDEMIRIIREEDNPLHELMRTFGLSDIQANAILDTKLRQLARLEESQINTELNKLKKEATKLLSIINSENKLNNVICKELDGIIKLFGAPRNCAIENATEAKAFTETEVLLKEDITVLISDKDQIKSGKGHNLDDDKKNFRTEDKVKLAIELISNDTLCLLGNSGRIYNISVHDLPSLKSNGDSIAKKINPAPLEKIANAFPLRGTENFMLIASNNGYGFFTEKENLETRNKGGKVLITLKNNEAPLLPYFVKSPKNMLCLCATSTGRMLTFDATEIPILTKGKGNQLMNIPKQNFSQGEVLLFTMTIPKNTGVNIYHDDIVTSISAESMLNYQGSRGRRGMKLPKEINIINSISAAQ
jgi:topoisomerase-4 subunit A